jgi:hypothetical protein
MPCSRGPMTLILLATTGLLACAFYAYVLYQWMRDTNGTRTTRRAGDRGTEGKQATKRPYVVSSREAADSQDRSGVRSHRAPMVVKRSGDREAEWNATERIAYQRIASSLASRKRS